MRLRSGDMSNFGIRFSFRNANGLSGKSLELEHYNTDNLIDVMIINETHFNTR